MYSGRTPDDGHRNCPKHVEFYSKNKFEKLVHLVVFIVTIYHDDRSPERQIHYSNYIFTSCFMYNTQLKDSFLIAFKIAWRRTEGLQSTGMSL